MSPATPPHTPGRNQHSSPKKGRDSMTKARESPSKQKLQIGQNGFYFSCELPMSKITPTKAGTPTDTGSPKRDGILTTPTGRAPSPLKKLSPVKKSPARALFGTPTRKAGTPTQSRAGTPVKRTGQSNDSPAKSIEATSDAAQKLSSAPIATLRIPPECLEDVTEEQVANATLSAPAVSTASDESQSIEKARTSMISQPLNIGHLLAGLKVSASKTRHPIEDDDSKNKGRIQKSEPPTPLRRAAETLPSTEFSTMPGPDQNHTLNISVGTQTVRRLPETAAKPPTALDMMRQEQALQYPTPLFPKSEAEQEKAPPSKKHVKWQGSHLSFSKTPKCDPAAAQKRIGTDLTVFETMRKEMVKTEASMRRSTGQENFLRRPVNNNELPEMSNTLFQKDQKAEMLSQVTTTSTSRAYSREESDASSSTVRASMVTSAQKRDGTPNAQSTPRLVSQEATPVAARRGKSAPTKQVERSQVGGASAMKTCSTSPRKPIMSPGTATSVILTPQKQRAIPHSVDTPFSPRVRDFAVRATPVLTPAKSSNESAPIPHRVRKSNFDTPSSTRVLSSAITPEMTRNPHPKKSLSVTTKKPARPVAKEPYNPATDPRPYEMKFASAVDIADRVAKWHSDDRKKAATPAIPATPRAEMSPTKPSIKANAQKMNRGSYTPPGSPTKLRSPTKNPSLHPPHPKPPGTAKRTPRTPAPRTAKDAVTRTRNAHMLKTPTSTTRRTSFLDRNALRTPSKAIETSLDRAIDAKIAEDAASGKEFTPSGNRIKDLLDARKGKEV
ncbi:hypothetical protein N0V83_003236 [Neocucurbitaria cava]|uniref:Uncharacterized protein n=1 Tax=Neocucurbitaria cava TaxID=798079 RepID=A0A9W9CP35_9PLEO|nr:hypothetical protein N0V83_003236 [Neocucurbitaria cava]